jgi:hypothetical protein
MKRHDNLWSQSIARSPRMKGELDHIGDQKTARPPEGGLSSIREVAIERKSGAGEGARTLDPDLGKVVLYH